MAVNEHNYEAYFLDYIEGNLSTEDTAELLLFLEVNPHLKNEVEGFEINTLAPVQESGFNKETLKKNINTNNVEDYIIGSIENINTKEDEQELATFINQNSQYKTLLNRYQKTIIPAPSILFEDKNALKKKSQLIVLYPLIGIAASLLVLFLLSINKPSHEYNPQGLSGIDTTGLYTPSIQNYIAIEEVEIPKEKVNVTDEGIYIPKKDSVPKILIEPQQELIAVKNDTAITDSITVFFEPDGENFIAVEDSATQPEDIEMVVAESNNNLTVNEWANKQIRNKVFNQETENADKIENEEILNAVANGLNKISKQEIAYNNESNGNYTTKGFSIGSFEFSRTKRKKF